MIHATFIVVLLTGPMCHQAASDASAADAEASLILFDRLHQTFILLNHAVFPAYEEHFLDEPDKLATVRHYSTRLAETLRSGSPTESSDSSEADSEDASAEHLMRQALAAARAGRQDLLDRHLQRLGSQPHAVLQRLGDAWSLATAHCLLYDPELLWAHRWLWELKIGRHAPGDPINVQDGLADRQMDIRRLREQPENAELSLRKFMDKYRSLVWELGVGLAVPVSWPPGRAQRKHRPLP